MTLSFLLLATVIGCSLACSCVYEHPQTKFCEADFVVKAKVKRVHGVATNHSGLENGGLKTFYVKIKETYKETPSFLKVFKAMKGHVQHTERAKLSKAYTPLQSSTCGVNLRTGEKYVLSGKVVFGKLSVTMCDIVIPWTDVVTHVRMRKALANEQYMKNCNCLIRTCWNEEACSEHRQRGFSDSCLWNLARDTQFCYEKNSVCQRRGKKCRWTKPGLLQSCLKEARNVEP